MSLFLHRSRVDRWSADERSALAEAVAEDRAAAWSRLGRLDPTVVATLSDTAGTGAARWPSDRRAFLRITRPGSTLIVSDGLSDPYDRLSEPGTGLGCELCLDTAALAGVPAGDLWDRWPFRLLYRAAETVALLSVDVPARMCDGAFVLELGAVGAPAAWTDERGTVGAILGVRRPELPAALDLATGTACVVSVIPLRPVERRAAADPAVLREIAGRLAALPHEELVHPARPVMV